MLLLSCSPPDSFLVNSEREGEREKETETERERESTGGGRERWRTWTRGDWGDWEDRDIIVHLFDEQPPVDRKWPDFLLRICTPSWPPYKSAGISLYAIPCGRLQQLALSRKKDVPLSQSTLLSPSKHYR